MNYSEFKYAILGLTFAIGSLASQTANAQGGPKENPRGVYKLQSMNGKPAAFQQYKICTENPTLQAMTVTRSGQVMMQFQNPDNWVFNYTGLNDHSTNPHRVQVYDSDAKGFTLRWWNTDVNAPGFDYKDWNIEKYVAGYYTEEEKAAFDLIMNPLPSADDGTLTGGWLKVGQFQLNSGSFAEEDVQYMLATFRKYTTPFDELLGNIIVLTKSSILECGSIVVYSDRGIEVTASTIHIGDSVSTLLIRDDDYIVLKDGTSYEVWRRISGIRLIDIVAKRNPLASH